MIKYVQNSDIHQTTTLEVKHLVLGSFIFHYSGGDIVFTKSRLKMSCSKDYLFCNLG